MKKTIAYILLLLLMMTQICFPVSAETYIPSRVINLVYDDSGSMIRTDGAYVDTWCQAKYAMEVFAAMLGEKEIVKTKDALHRICASPTVSCPPAIPIVISGEEIDEKAVELFEYYGVTEIEVVK
ncbi:MAG: hypothetical protein J6V56_02555 [Clostridia bacterium]|nr:hypothetical protein [Clostridia bacterium]